MNKDPFPFCGYGHCLVFFFLSAPFGSVLLTQQTCAGSAEMPEAWACAVLSRLHTVKGSPWTFCELFYKWCNLAAITLYLTFNSALVGQVATPLAVSRRCQHECTPGVGRRHLWAGWVLRYLWWTRNHGKNTCERLYQTLTNKIGALFFKPFVALT